MNNYMDTYRTSQRERTERAAREAAEWLEVMRGQPDADVRKAFSVWIAASPVHVRELLLASMVDRVLASPGVFDAFDVDAVVAEAKAAVADSVVVMPQHGRQAPAAGVSPHRSRRGWRRARIAAAAAVVLLAVVSWAGLRWQSNTGTLYASTAGEQRAITLVDGTHVTLAPESRLRVDYSQGLRRVELEQGEARFSVVHNAARPFRVQAGASIIQDVGTRFSVNRLPSGTVVSVSEGEVRVTVDPLASFGGEVQQWVGAWMSSRIAPLEPTVLKVAPVKGGLSLTAGEAAHLTRNGKYRASISVAERTQPTTHVKRLVFHDATLADIATEFNRYNARRIVVEGDAVRDMRFSGVFDANDADSFLQFLDCCSALAVRHDQAGIEISKRPGEAESDH